MTEESESSKDKLQGLLKQKSSSRIGRLNQRGQQIAIQQLVNENSFTKDFQRKVAKQERLLNTSNVMDNLARQNSKNLKKETKKEKKKEQVQKPQEDTAALLKSAFDEKDQKRVQKMLKERCQEIIEGKAPSIIQKIVTKMKQKNGQRPMAFYKDNILQYHNEYVNKYSTHGSSQGFLLSRASHHRRKSDQANGLSDQSDDEKYSEKRKAKKSLHGTQTAMSKTFKKKANDSDDDAPIDDYFTRKYSYYHIKHATLERNQRNMKSKQFNYKSVFKTLSREQREQFENKPKECIPGVGKYRPKFEYSHAVKPPIKFSEDGKDEYVRSRNFLMLPRFHQEYKSTANLMEKQRLNQNSSSGLIKVESTEAMTAAPQVSNDDFENLYTERSKKTLKRSKTQKNHNKSDINLINASPGLIPYDRQSTRKFVFEKCCRVNEERFNMLNLPRIYSKNLRVKGAIDFNLGPVRKELFPQKIEMPDYYRPKYDSTMPRNICSVKDLGQKSFIEYKKRVEPEDPYYYNHHMI